MVKEWFLTTTGDHHVMTTTVNRTMITNTTLADEIDALPSTSARIRFLVGRGYTYYRIGKILNIRPQHARNVAVTPLKKS